MSGLSLTTLCGDAAHLVAAQAELISKVQGRFIYRLRTEQLRIAVYDDAARCLVVFDAAALVALTDAELRDPAAPAAPVNDPRITQE